MRSAKRLIAAAFCGAYLAFTLAIAVSASPSLAVRATRQDPSGQVVFAPAITDRQGVIQPPLALPGQYIIATGSGFPANMPFTATLNDGTKTIPLMYQELTSTGATTPPTPITDAMGGISGAAFLVPPASAINAQRCTFTLTSGGVVIGALVDVAIPDPNAISGDKLVIEAALVFYVLMGIVFFALLRRLPTYPIVRGPHGSRQIPSDAGT